MSAWTLPWPRVALAALILIGILGGITSRQMSALRRVLASTQAGKCEGVQGLQDAMLRVSLSVRIALLFAAVLLMNAKPGR